MTTPPHSARSALLVRTHSVPLQRWAVTLHERSRRVLVLLQQVQRELPSPLGLALRPLSHRGAWEYRRNAIFRLEAGRDVRLLVAGDGSQRDELFSLARELGIADHAKSAGAMQNRRAATRVDGSDLCLCVRIGHAWPASCCCCLDASRNHFLGSDLGAVSID